MWRPTYSYDELYHSRGPWKNHKYLKIVDGRYIYNQASGAVRKAGKAIADQVGKVDRGIRARKTAAVAQRQGEARSMREASYRQRKMREADDAAARKKIQANFRRGAVKNAIPNLINKGKKKVKAYLTKYKAKKNAGVYRGAAASDVTRKERAEARFQAGMAAGRKRNKARLRREAFNNAVSNVKNAYNSTVKGAKKAANNAYGAANKAVRNTKVYKEYRFQQGLKAGRKRYAGKSARVKKNRKWSKV